MRPKPPIHTAVRTKQAFAFNWGRSASKINRISELATNVYCGRAPTHLNPYARTPYRAAKTCCLLAAPRQHGEALLPGWAAARKLWHCGGSLLCRPRRRRRCLLRRPCRRRLAEEAVLQRLDGADAFLWIVRHHLPQQLHLRPAVRGFYDSHSLLHSASTAVAKPVGRRCDR